MASGDFGVRKLACPAEASSSAPDSDRLGELKSTGLSSGWAFGLLTLVPLALALLLHTLAIDDAYITYRYAANASRGQGFVYNPGQPTLSTTAPLWGLVLAGLGILFGAERIPLLANILSALCLWGGGLILWREGRRRGWPWAGLVAALAYVSCPLLWLSLGMESGWYLLLVLGAFHAAGQRDARWLVAAALLALATPSRYDALVPTGIIFGWALWHQLREGGVRALPWWAVAAYFLLLAPFMAWLGWQFGSPLPETLAAKRAQSALGVTGFFPHTTFLEGVGILLQAYFAQTAAYGALVPLLLVGLWAGATRARWVLPVLLWALFHILAYLLLGVTPYIWYYAPLVPAGAWCLGLGTELLVRWRALPLAELLMTALLAAFLLSDARMIAALHGGRVPPPEDVISKVLPEAKADSYRQVGEWLMANTPEDALVGVTEVGIIGFYAQRPMVDFLGLLQPDVAEALRRGDMAYALLRYQPDYVALTAINPLYNYDPLRDPWFQAAYQPVRALEDPRFWASPITIYRRRGKRQLLTLDAEMPPSASRLNVEFGGRIRLLGYELGRDTLRPGEVLPLRLFWQAMRPVKHDYTVFVHLLDAEELVVAQRDSQPVLGSYPTSRWQPGQVVSDLYLVALPATAYAPDEVQVEVGLYLPETWQRLSTQSAEGKALGDNVRFGRLEVKPTARGFDFGNGVTLMGYTYNRRGLQAGGELVITLHWRARAAIDGDYKVFLHLLDEQGTRWAQRDTWPGRWPVGQEITDSHLLSLPSQMPPGVYHPIVGLYRPSDGSRIPLLNKIGQPIGDHLRLAPVRVTSAGVSPPCRTGPRAER